ncbi:hypothetical protein VTN77DRAFT_5244 [Rasamsonia byssochlamydoides]|uniref:uncharacterized protein n=1 Tax=Rasamsonia byssochlamydoides TaxID=89139 RepID=UPI003743A9B4
MGGNQEQNPLTDSEVLSSSLKVGALSAFGGFTYGGVSGVLRSSPHPVIRSISHGIYWFAFGSSFWWIRSNILKLHFEDNATPKERAYTSALSGGIAGGGVTRLMGGRLIPGVVVFSLLGYLGQSSWNAIEKWRLESANTSTKPILQRIADSKWVPLRSLSDDDFKHILSEKLLSIEAEIAILDEKIQELQQEKMAGNRESKDQRPQNRS